jgi:hypothetical protein
MPRLLDRSPIPDEPTEFVIGQERIRVRANQIILWITLTPKMFNYPDPRSIPFPVILDTGHTHTFSIREQHLIDWAKLRPEQMSVESAVRDRGQRLLLRAANIWCHPNECGSRHRSSDQQPYGLAAPKGIAIYSGDFPRLPILGLRAIAENELILKINGKRRYATLHTPSKWWPFS